MVATEDDCKSDCKKTRKDELIRNELYVALAVRNFISNTSGIGTKVQRAPLASTTETTSSPD
jgi:hypothetical protein